ncbi:hypothetical protein M2651_05670 [Clostridium sp. SYSU_GA19001]|uniref:hypothetical protein n=1 Tax=Clostridium caldaquaticum TaxID=2940653 RepID=UPI0020771B50|nr:hypothetical protein [Clostridium caldaquaticum]MCM8710513.1 hypothetical protein [Clostridium caldaquaticum]
MAQQGWIKIYRKINESWLWSDKEPFDKRSAWIDLLLLANHAEKKVLIGNKLIEIKKGQFITSEVKLAERWHWSRKAVRNFLKLLEDDEMIKKIVEPNKYTSIVIMNFYKYQDSIIEDTSLDIENKDLENNQGTTKEQQKNNKRTTVEQLRNTNKNDKELYKNDKEINILSKDNICSTEELQRVIDKWNSLGLSSLKSINPDTNRYKQFRKRVKDYGIDEVINAIENINNSSFLKGQNKRGWVITFDWFIKPNNFIKVLENNYADKSKQEPEELKKTKKTRELIFAEGG